MLHTMNLAPAPMQMMRSGQKTIELRLYDEKRQRISIGDTIEFANTENISPQSDVSCPAAASITALLI